MVEINWLSSVGLLIDIAGATTIFVFGLPSKFIHAAATARGEYGSD